MRFNGGLIDDFKKRGQTWRVQKNKWTRNKLINAWKNKWVLKRNKCTFYQGEDLIKWILHVKILVYYYPYKLWTRHYFLQCRKYFHTYSWNNYFSFIAYWPYWRKEAQESWNKNVEILGTQLAKIQKTNSGSLTMPLINFDPLIISYRQ